MTRKYLSGSHDESWSNALRAKERCFSASFLISFSIGHTAPCFTNEKGDDAIPIFLATATFTATHHSAALETPFGRPASITSAVA